MMKLKIRAEISMYKDFEVEAEDPVKAIEIIGEQLAGKDIRELGLSKPKVCYHILDGIKWMEEKPARKQKSYVEQQRQLYAKAYTPWTEEDDNELREYVKKGFSFFKITDLMERNEGAIKSRMKKLGLNKK